MAHIQNALLRGADWQHKGYCGQGNVVDLLDSCLGRTAIIAGNGKGVFEEYDEIYDGTQIVYAVNDVGVYLPHVDHFISLHGFKLDYWVALKRDPTCAGIGNKNFKVHDAGLHGYRDWYQWKALTPLLPLSGLFAAQIAYLMGCERIILIGCPNDFSPRFFEARATNKAYKDTQFTVKQEMAFKPEFKAVIRSVSGWSKEFFGEP